MENREEEKGRKEEEEEEGRGGEKKKKKPNKQTNRLRTKLKGVAFVAIVALLRSEHSSSTDTLRGKCG